MLIQKTGLNLVAAQTSRARASNRHLQVPLSRTFLPRVEPPQVSALNPQHGHQPRKTPWLSLTRATGTPSPLHHQCRSSTTATKDVCPKAWRKARLKGIQIICFIQVPLDLLCYHLLKSRCPETGGLRLDGNYLKEGKGFFSEEDKPSPLKLMVALL